MAAFVTDADLVRLAPRVFVDAAEEATDVLSATDGATSVTTLTSAGSDFAALDVDAGDVALIAGEPMEVIERVSATALTVSKPRADDAAAAIAPGDGSAQTLIIRSFARLRTQVEDFTLRLLGVGEISGGIMIESSMILNPSDLTAYLAQRIIAQAYARASSANPAEAALAALAQQHAVEAERVRRSLAIRLDLDGDGEADATRRLSVITLRPR